MTFSQAQVEAAFDHFSSNWGEIEAGGSCSFCLRSFEAGDVTAVDEQVDGMSIRHSVSGARSTYTAVCPHCRTPYCLGDASGLPIKDASYLLAVQQHWHR